MEDKMTDFLYAVHSDQPAPATGGDAVSWLLYYKWEVEGSCFIPVELAPVWLSVQPGDHLWLVTNRKLLGRVTITHLEVETSQRRIELWYDMDSALEMTMDSTQSPDWLTRNLLYTFSGCELPEKYAKEWLENTKLKKVERTT
jgi:hypothetical protein